MVFADSGYLYAKPSATTVFTMQDIVILFFHMKEFQLPVAS